MMTARFKGHVHCRATGLVASGAQGIGLGMGLAGALMPAFADNLPVTHYHAADPRVGVGGVQALARQFEGAGEAIAVVFAPF